MSSWIALLLVCLLAGGCDRTPEPLNSRTAERTNPRTSELRNPGTLEPRTAGTLEPQNPGTLKAGQPVPATVIAGARHWQREGAAGSRILVINFGSTRCPAQSGCAETERKLRLVQDELGKT